MMEDTDRCGRAGADGGRAAVAAGRLAVCLRGRVQSHGVLGDAALAAVVLRGERVRRRKLCRDAVLWGRELGGVIGLGHRFWGVGGLLVTLGGRGREREKTKIKDQSQPTVVWTCCERGNGAVRRGRAGGALGLGGD